MEHSLQGKTGNIPAKVKRRKTSDRVATGEESHDDTVIHFKSELPNEDVSVTRCSRMSQSP